MKSELSSVIQGAQVVEIWYDGKMVGTVYGADGPGIRVLSKHHLQTSTIPGLIEEAMVSVKEKVSVQEKSNGDKMRYLIRVLVGNELRHKAMDDRTLAEAMFDGICKAAPVGTKIQLAEVLRECEIKSPDQQEECRENYPAQGAKSAESTLHKPEVQEKNQGESEGGSDYFARADGSG